MFSELQVLKPTRKKPKQGDVFVISPKEDCFCFGKVIAVNVESNDVFVNGMNLIFIYDCFSDEKELPEHLENNRLMMPPIIVNNQLWIKGYAETIESREVTIKDKEIDYGFRDVSKRGIEYVDIEGNAIEKVPEYIGIFGLGSYGVIGRELSKIIEDRNL